MVSPELPPRITPGIREQNSWSGVRLSPRLFLISTLDVVVGQALAPVVPAGRGLPIADDDDLARPDPLAQHADLEQLGVPVADAHDAPRPRLAGDRHLEIAPALQHEQLVAGGQRDDRNHTNHARTYGQFGCSQRSKQYAGDDACSDSYNTKYSSTVHDNLLRPV